MMDEMAHGQLDDESEESFADMLASQDINASQVQPGMKVTGSIIEISGESVFLDIGIKVDGVMDVKDLGDASGERKYGLGDSVEGWVTSVTPHEIRVSRSMSGSGMAALEEAFDSQIPVVGKIIATCKGGYSVEVLGKRAFCPGSQLDAVSQADSEKQVGRSLPFLILKLDNRGRNIVVSHRALKDRERETSLGRLLETLEVGDVVSGTISRLTPFGAFMELAPGVDGLIHVSELGWSHIEKPEDAVSIGDNVSAKVLAIDKDAKKGLRISLSRKKAEDDPWSRVSEFLSPGAVVQGKVMRFAPFGVFIELLPGIEGLAHISELSWSRRVNRPEDMLKKDELVSVKIRDINPDGRRISLSLRDAEGDPWQDVDKHLSPGSRVMGTLESKSQYGLFINILPGITALMPAAMVRKDPAMSRLELGQEAEFIVQSVNAPERRICLASVSAADAAEHDDKSWQFHPAVRQPAGNLGIMAQAFQKAYEKTRGR